MSLSLSPIRWALSALLVSFFASASRAQNYYWDGGTTNIAGNGDGVSLGGAGTWNTSTTNWDAGVGVSYVAWPNTGTDIANFGGSAGVVTLGTNVNVGGMVFTVGGYTVTANTITIPTTGTSGAVGTIAVSNAGTTTIASVIAGGVTNQSASNTLGSVPSLTVSGGGILLLNATNTFTGDIVVTGAGTTLSFAGDGNLGATASGFYKSVVIQNGATAIYTGTGTYNPTTGANTSNKQFPIGTGGGTINVSSGTGLLQLDDPGQFVYVGTNAGTDTFTKTGAGVMMLNTTYNFIPTVNIAGGTLRVDTAGATSLGSTAGSLATNNAINVSNGAAFDVRVTLTALRIINILSTGGVVINGSTTNTITVPSVVLSGNVTLGGIGNLTLTTLDLGSANRAITKIGTGTTTVNGTAANATGTTTAVVVTAGALVSSTATSLGATLNVTATNAFSEYLQTTAASTGSTYAFGPNTILAGNSTFFNSLSTAGGTPNLTLGVGVTIAETAAGANAAAVTQFGLANDASRFFGVAGSITDSVAVGTGTPWAGISNDSVTGRSYAGTITANSDFTIRATNGVTFVLNQITLTPASARTVTISGGTVQLSSTSNSFNNNVTLSVANGATIQPTAANVFGANTAVGGAGNNAAINVLSGGIYNPNAVTVNANITIQPGGILNIDDATNLTGTGTITQFAGSITRFTSDTNAAAGLNGAVLPGTVAGSIIRLAASPVGSLPTKIDNAAIFEVFGGNRTLPAAAPALTVNGVGNVSIGVFTNIPTGVITNDGASRTLNNASTTTASVISVGSGGATFVGTDNTTLSLLGSGANPSSGTLAIAAGTNTINIGVASLVTIDGFAKGGVSGGVLYGGPTDSGGTAGLTAGAINVLSGTFTINGGGVFYRIDLTGSGTVGQLTGLLTLNNGTTLISNTGSLIDGQVNSLVGGIARFQAGGTDNATAAQLIGGLQGTGGYFFLGNNSGGTNRDVALTIGSNNLSSTFAGVISDTDSTRNGSIIKTGTGTLTLTGNNTYTLGTTISGGTLQVGTGGATGAIAGAVVNNAALGINTTTSFSLAAVSGSGTLIKAGTGTVTLTAAPTYNGATTINGGGLTITAVGTGTPVTLSYPTSGLSVGTGGRFAYTPTATSLLSLTAPISLADGSYLGFTVGNTAGSAISTTGVVTVASGANISLAVTGSAGTGTNTYTILSGGSGSNLDVANYTLLNPVNYTYTLAKTATTVSVTTTAATALTSEFYIGGYAGNVLAASNGISATPQSNWATTQAGTTITPLIPGPTATVTFSATGASGQGNISLGANMSVAGLVVNDTTPIAITDAANTLTIGTGGITQNSAAGATGGLNLATHVTAGGAQSWTNNSGSTLTVGGANQTVAFGSNTVTVTGTGVTTIAGNITGAAGTLTKTGTGQLNLTGATNSLLILNMNSASTLDIGSGTLTIGNSTTGSNTIQSNITSGTATINATGGGAILLPRSGTDGPDNGVENGGTLLINAKITGPGSFEFFRTAVTTGTIVLANTANDFAGGIIINVGIISTPSVGNNGAASGLGLGSTITINGGNSGIATLRYTGTGEVSNKIISLAGTTGGGQIEQAGTGALVFTSNLAQPGDGAKIFTLLGSTAGTGEIAGVIPDRSATSTTSVTKTGTGTWTLSGANTYTGTTSISNGTLIITGNQSVSTGTVAMTGTSQLRGNGTLGGAITTAAGTPTVTPGVSGFTTATGATLTVANTAGATFGSTSTFGVVINAAGNADATGKGLSSTGGNNNLLNLNGNFAPLNLTSGMTVNIDGTGVTFAENTAYSYKVAQAGSAISIPGTVNFSTTGFTGTNFSLTTDGSNALYVNFTAAVPEPTTIFGLAAAGFGLAGWGRRRQTCSA